jgi:hypothetical protein
VRLQVLVPEQLVVSAVPSAKLQQRLVQKGCTLYLAVSHLAKAVILAGIPCGTQQLQYDLHTTMQPKPSCSHGCHVSAQRLHNHNKHPVRIF